jgi:NTP pyrophosphatase (non-canonical NTP hydrolase)
MADTTNNSTLTLDDYQRQAMRTGSGSAPEIRLNLSAMGLAGEAGEFVDLVKKHLYHGHPLDKEKAKKELGDVLWYVAFAAYALDLDLSTVGEANIAKLKARYPNGFSSEASLNRKPESEGSR